MHFPKSKTTKELGQHTATHRQQNILQQMFDNKDPDTGRPIATSANSYNKWLLEEQTRLKIWKTLRELDTMPVFIPHLEEELFNLLRKNSRIGKAKNAIGEVLKTLLDEWEG